jgi:hypothetical protein
LDPGRRALQADELDDRFDRLGVLVGPGSEAVRRDPPTGFDGGRLGHHDPAPPAARAPRWTRCQSFASPSSAEYWHIGDGITEVRGESPAVHGGDESDKPSTNYVRRAERMFK